MRSIRVRYDHYFHYEIPDNLKLWPNSKLENCDYDLDEKDGKYYFPNAPNVSPVGYWWVKWSILYYIDENCNIKEIKGDDSDFSTKWHSDIYDDKDEEEDEEEDDEKIIKN